MNKNIIIFMIVLMTGLVIAQGIELNNRNLTLDKAYKVALDSKNLSTYETTDYCRGDLCKRCLYQDDNKTFEGLGIDDEVVYYVKNVSILNTCSRWMSNTSLDNWEKERMVGIAIAEIDRSNLGNATKVEEGTTTINEKK